MSKIGRNDPCPSGTGTKFKKCLRQHPELSPQSTVADVWWVCDCWQAETPAFADLWKAWRSLPNPEPNKSDQFLDLVFSQPVDSVDWEILFRECRDKNHPDLPGLYRRITTLLAEVSGPEPARLQRTAAGILRDQHPELYPEVLAATLALDPDHTQVDFLEDIIVWAKERESVDDCDRLRERFSEFPEYMFAEPEEEESDLEVDQENEPEFPPEITRELDKIWDEMEAIKSPTIQDVETFVDRLLAQPHEATSWVEVFDVARDVDQVDVFKIFDQITSALLPAGCKDLAFLHWGVIEELEQRNQTERFPAIIRKFLQLDSRSFDCDAFDHVNDHLLSRGYAKEALALMEHFLPIIRDSQDLFDWVITEVAAKILTLRIGEWIACGEYSKSDAETMRAVLLADISEDLDTEFVTLLVHRLLEPQDLVASRENFELPLPSHSAERKRTSWIMRQVALIEVARSEWEASRVHPSQSLIGLEMIDQVALGKPATPRKKGSKHPPNLLDHLNTKTIEGQVVHECRSMFGINPPRARVMLAAYAALAHWAGRHGLMEEADELKVCQKVADLAKQIAS